MNRGQSLRYQGNVGTEPSAACCCVRVSCSAVQACDIFAFWALTLAGQAARCFLLCLVVSLLVGRDVPVVAAAKYLGWDVLCVMEPCSKFIHDRYVSHACGELFERC